MAINQRSDPEYHRYMAELFHDQADEMMAQGAEESALWNRVEAYEHEDKVNELSSGTKYSQK